MLVAGIPVLTGMRRRFLILSVKEDNHRSYKLVMAAVIALSIMASQEYLLSNSYDLIKVFSIKEIKSLKQQKCFRIQSFKLDREVAAPFQTSRSSGKQNEYLTFYLYLACPFEGVDDIWYGVEYKKTIRRQSDEENNRAYQNFVNSSFRAFRHYNFNNVAYFEKLAYSDERDGFLNSIKEVHPNIKENAQTILVPKTSLFDKERGSSILWIFGTFGVTALIFLMMVLSADVNREELSKFEKKIPFKEDGLKEFLALISLSELDRISAILIIINVIVFVCMVFSGLNIMSPTPHELLEIGGNRRLEVLNGEYWRLLSALFLHAGGIHLIMNMSGLALSSILIEKILGPTWLLITYFVCGLLANLSSIYWYENVVSVGASGAVLGLFGVMLILNVLKIIPEGERELAWTILGLFGGISLAFGFITGADNAAHIGGALSGMLLGLLFVGMDKERLSKRAK